MELSGNVVDSLRDDVRYLIHAQSLAQSGIYLQIWANGKYKFENFEIIPLFDVGIEVIVDPKIVNDWPFSGWDGGDIGHTFLISACKQEKPCK